MLRALTPKGSDVHWLLMCAVALAVAVAITVGLSADTAGMQLAMRQRPQLPGGGRILPKNIGTVPV
jgi:hypothetical protein